MNTNIFKAVFSEDEQGHGRTRQRLKWAKTYLGGRMKVCLHSDGNNPIKGETAEADATVKCRGKR